MAALLPQQWECVMNEEDDDIPVDEPVYWC